MGDCEIEILSTERTPVPDNRGKVTFKITNIFRQPSQEKRITKYFKIKYR